MNSVIHSEYFMGKNGLSFVPYTFNTEITKDYVDLILKLEGREESHVAKNELKKLEHAKK